MLHVAIADRRLCSDGKPMDRSGAKLPVMASVTTTLPRGLAGVGDSAAGTGVAASDLGPGGAMMTASAHGPVLVVEDHPVNRLLLQRVLELEEIEVIAAASIDEAERALEGFVPPVIVLDLHLPDGYGLDLARKLKRDPAMADCAIVACTAGPVANEEALARSVGCAEYVTKPIDTREFAKLVKSLIPVAANT